jgi:hypothetical protein
MIPEFNRSWTETEVKALIGQSESIRREFKAGMLFGREPESKWRDVLSKEVSAFANTEGGELILGIQEDKSNPGVASGIDGVPTTVSRERLKDLIQGNLSPHLPGIGLQRVKLSEPPDRVVFVIQIPQGTTAYQARDRLYYGRSEFNVEALPDHEVRLRMMRRQVAQVDVRSVEWTCRTEQRSQHCINQVQEAARKLEEAKKNTETQRIFSGTPRRMVEITPQMRVETAKMQLEAAERDLEASKAHDEFSFLLQLTNVGGTTIRDFLCVVRNAGFDNLFVVPSGNDISAFPIGSQIPYRFAEARVTQVTGQAGPEWTQQTHWQGLEKKLFPQESTGLPFGRWVLRIPHPPVAPPGDATLEWTVFLDDAPPSRGGIVLDPRRAVAATQDATADA